MTEALNKLDMALDEITTQTKKKPGQRRRGTGPQRGVSRNATPQATLGLVNADVGSKLLVSNLHFGVTESDLRELFSSVGPLKKVSLAFDANGKSKGTAEVLFVRKNDAVSAVKRYNKVALDGRPMNLEMVMTTSSISSRLGNRQQDNKPYQRKGRRPFRKNRGPKKNAEDLDNEMDVYMNEASANDTTEVQ